MQTQESVTFSITQTGVAPKFDIEDVYLKSLSLIVSNELCIGIKLPKRNLGMNDVFEVDFDKITLDLTHVSCSA